MNRQSWNKLSIGLNAVLIGALILLAARRSETPQESAVPAASGSMSAATRPDSNPSESKLKANITVAPKPATSDWQQWVEPMRAAGVPNRVIARMVLADFDDRWQKREDEFQQRFARGEADADAITAMQEEREREQERELRAALGEEGYVEWDREILLNGINMRAAKLSGTETNTIYAWQKDLQRQFHELELARRKGELDEADFTDLQAKAQAAFDQRLKTLLGDDRYAATQGMPDDSGELRRSLKSVNPTDNQFQELLDVQRQWNERRAELDRKLQENKSVETSYTEQIQSIDQARDREYERVLGTNAFDAYQKGQDSRYTTMKRYANAWGLDDQSIEHIYRTLKFYERNVEDYNRRAREMEQQGQAVDWEAVNKNLRQFSQQTEQDLQAYLGNDRYTKIKRNQVFVFEP